jgi:potassium-transporting ATPase KdpC subunit
MNNKVQHQNVAIQIVTSVRIALATMAICCILYTLTILCIGQLLVPYTANGSLIHNDQGKIIGSSSLAQGFSHEKYFWPRPSAVRYNASQAGGSNWSPANPALRIRAEAILAIMKSTDEKPIPADLVTASGSGLDPHITLNAAGYQARRVASARGLPYLTVMEMIRRYVKQPGAWLTREPLVNVLSLNMALDRMVK